MEETNHKEEFEELRSEINKLKEELIKEREIKGYSLLLQEIVDKSPYPMWISDAAGLMQKANRALLDTLGLNNEDLIGKYNILEDKNLEKEGFYNDIKDVFTKLTTTTIMMSWDGKNSRIDEIKNARKVWIEASFFPIIDKKGVLTNVICQWFNITKQKEAELKLAKQNQELESIVHERTKELEEKNQELERTSQNLAEIQSKMMESDKMASLGFLTASIAHDLNSPLNFIYSGYQQLVELLKEKNAINKEESQVWLDAIDKGVHNCVNIIKSLNQFSRTNIEDNESLDIHNVLDNCLLILHNKLKYRINIKKDYCKKDISISGNSGQMHQLFLNIITNAMHAIEDKGIITIETRSAENHITIKVTDDGCGIKQEHLTKIMDPFFTTKPPGFGTGLGLSITQKIVKEHNGTLEIESQPNLGTTVKIILPSKI
ncbi:PAS domain-containing sensor histidine kinase [Plebeiibacterium sediminum]|uniref:histidine kinase n=1 Tax=Plebeiibacterium sediminum TaxID=2992112 RepID=A0AAE3M3D9_9BACT|nr:ATP-binding protein [Plebeiobacterium sediminum]MCW3786442.1 ATP-binding protein [Plebeiobacterium sediminum]